MTKELQTLTERQWQRMVEKMARLFGWLCYHTYDSRRSEPGFPDLCLVKEDLLIFAELKTDAGKLTHHQKKWLRALDGAGAEVYVWRPKDYKDVRQLLREGRGLRG